MGSSKTKKENMVETDAEKAAREAKEADVLRAKKVISDYKKSVKENRKKITKQQDAEREKAKMEKEQRFIPSSAGWNNYNAFMAIVPAMIAKGNTGVSLKRKDMTDMYAHFSSEWAQGVEQAQANLYKNLSGPGPLNKPITNRADYMRELQNEIASTNNSFNKYTADGTDPNDNEIPRAETLKDWWNTTGESLRAGRQDYTHSTIDPKLDTDKAPAGTNAFTGEASDPTKGYTPGSYVEGLGIVGAGGKLSKGLTTNVGGGDIDTEIEKTQKGDVVGKGPQSVNVATKTLRPSFVIAGGEDVRPDEQANLQSDALFEAFSWVPDGYGLGPDNNLHLMNKQNDALRYGMGPLSMPRQLVDTNMPHACPMQWSEAMPESMVDQFLEEQEGLDMLIDIGFASQLENPLRVLDHDYNNFPSFKTLPRQLEGPSPFQPVVDNTEQYWPATDPSGHLMDTLGFQDSMSGTQGHKRLSTFGRL